MTPPPHEFLLLDAAILAAHPQLDMLLALPGATALYRDFADPQADRCGPWLLDYGPARALLDNADFTAPFCFGFCQLKTHASHGEVLAHLMTQRFLAFEGGDRYFLRFADGRALHTLAQVMTPEQVQQLKGPIQEWYYLQADGQPHKLGPDRPAVYPRQPEIILTPAQSDQLMALQLALHLAQDLHEAAPHQPHPQHDPARFAHIQAVAAFTLEHGIDPQHIQLHLARLNLQSQGHLLRNPAFIDSVARLKPRRQFDELLQWRLNPAGEQ